MGKLISRPKAPRIALAPPAPSASTATAAVATTATDTTAPPVGAGGSDSDAAPEITADEQRLENILTRRRGRFGTLATSFNGLADTSAIPVRKTLLGE